MGCTTILTSELPSGNHYYSRDTFSEYACDGIIVLESTVMGSELNRSIRVAKMRSTAMDGGRYSLEISKKGLLVGQ